MTGIKTYMNKYIRIVLGSGLLAFSIKCIYDPNGMVIGGFSGIAIIVKQLTEQYIAGGVPLGVTTFCLNVPFFILAYQEKGIEFVKSTVLATILVSVWLMALPEYALTPDDLLLTAIAGGLIGGSGIGIVLTAGSTTGGTDMVASLLQRKLPSYTVAQIMAGIDAVIILVSVYIFGMTVALYAGVSLFFHAKISDALVLGPHFGKSVFIITERPYEIASSIMNEMERGITGIHAQGMYTGDQKIMLYCVVSRKEIARLKEIVHQFDSCAFVIVGEAKEVLGEGF